MQMNRTTLRRLALIPAFVLATGAQAAVDAGVSTALADGKTDVGVVGLGVFVIAIAIATYKWFKRAL
jgi:hypothetical protein